MIYCQYRESPLFELKAETKWLKSTDPTWMFHGIFKEWVPNLMDEISCPQKKD